MLEAILAYCKAHESEVERMRQDAAQAESNPEPWIAELLETEELLD